MRVIEKEMINAINHRKYWTKDNTRVCPQSDCIEVWLYSTQIATIYSDRIVIRTGNWHTKTTKNRLNVILSEYTDYFIQQVEFSWYLVNKNVHSVRNSESFMENMTIPRA